MEEVELGRGDGQSGVGHGPAGDIQQRSRVAVLFQMPHGAFAAVGGAVHVEYIRPISHAGPSSESERPGRRHHQPL